MIEEQYLSQARRIVEAIENSDLPAGWWPQDQEKIEKIIAKELQEIKNEDRG